MATFHLHGQLITRSTGRSAVAAAAYRSGEALRDDRLEKLFDYTRKSDVDESVIIGPEGMPEWLRDREPLWNAVEAAERSNGQPAREFDVALPIELVRANPEAAKKALRDWATVTFVAHGLIIDISFHDMETHNPHAHIMSTTRPLHPDAHNFEPGSRYVFGLKARHLNDRGYMDFWRETWADFANAALAEHGIDARIDHRSLAEQGILHREPEIHLGPVVKAMEERGIETDRRQKWASRLSDIKASLQDNERAIERIQTLAEEAMPSESMGSSAEKAALEASQAELRRIEECHRRLHELGDRANRAIERSVNTKESALAAPSSSLQAAERTVMAAKEQILIASRGSASAAAAPTVVAPASAAGRDNITRAKVKEGPKSMGWNEDESWLGNGFVIPDPEDPSEKEEEAPAPQKWLSPHEQVDEEEVARSRELAALISRLRSAAPDLEALRNKVQRSAARLDRAAEKLLHRQEERLRLREEKLTALAPSMGKRGLAKIAQGLIKIGESADKLWTAAFNKESATNTGEEKAATTGKSMPPAELDRAWASDDWDANRLVRQLEAMKAVPLRRDDYCYVLDLKRLPAHVRTDAHNLHDHPRVRQYLDEVERRHSKMLSKLLEGNVPVVSKVGNFMLFVSPTKGHDSLGPLANELLLNCPQFAASATRAMERWASSSEVTAEAPPRQRAAAEQNHEKAGRAPAVTRDSAAEQERYEQSIAAMHERRMQRGRG